jgi:hypothetical protein
MKTSHGIFPHSLLKNIFLSILFSLAGYLGYSQVSFGVKSGINIATTKDLIEFPKNRIGWYVGGFGVIPLHKKFFLQIELLYSSKGQRTDKISGAQDKSITRLNYLNIPILFGYKIDRKTFFVLGPEIGWLTSAQLKYSGDFMNVSKNYPPKFDMAIDIGVNYMIIKKIGAEVRYSYGFNTIYTVDAVGNRNVETKGANRVFQIGLNYIL